MIYTMMPVRQLLSILALSALTLFSCKKDCDDSPSSVPSDGQLVINFSDATISQGLVDSGYVLLKKQGTTIPIMKRFDKADKKLFVAIDDLSGGSWSAEAYIYTRNAGDNSGRRYEQTKTFTVPLTSKNINWQAPDGSISDSWKPRIVLSDMYRKVIITVALDNTDPYFEIVTKEPKWDEFYIQRSALKRTNVGNELIANASWQCTNACYTHPQLNLIVNNTAFLPFTQEVAGEEWNNGEVNVEIRDRETNVVHEFFYVYNK